MDIYGKTIAYLKVYNHKKFWKRRTLLKTRRLFFPIKIWYHLYILRVQNKNCGFIGFEAEFKTPPKFPHELKGIFISNHAKIGANCTIFQHVIIGATAFDEDKNAKAPTIGDNCYIGAGAAIIGDVKIGNYVKIGANCIVAQDIPDYATVVLDKPRIIIKGDHYGQNSELSSRSYQTS